MRSMFLPLRRYAQFRGRATRREFWLFHFLFYGILIVVPILVPRIPEGVSIGIVGVVYLIALLAMIIPSLSVSIRRLHDHDKTGWFLLLSYIPFVGWLFWLIMMLTPGTRGGNSYGEDPREPAIDRIAGVFS